MRAYVCVYLMNNVYLCLSGRGLVCGSVREGCTLRLSDTQTHTDSTQRDTHTWQFVCGGKPCFIGWEVDVIWVFCWGARVFRTFPWVILPSADKSCTVGRSCLLQYPACILVHLRFRYSRMWKYCLPYRQSVPGCRHRFQIFYRINSRRTHRVVANWFPGNSLCGFHKVTLLNFPSDPPCFCFSSFHQSLEMKPWCQTISSSFRHSGTGTVSVQVTKNEKKQHLHVWVIEWIYYLTSLHLV